MGQTQTTSSVRRVLRAGDDLLGRTGVRHPRTQVPLLVFLAVMAILTIQRLLVLWTMPEYDEGASAGDRAWSLVVGLRFDAVIGCMLAAPLLALIIPSPPRLMRWKWYRRVIGGLCGLIVGVVVLTAISDYLFFKEFGQRLNYQVFEYTTYDYVQAAIWEDFPVIPSVIFAAVVGIAAGWWFRRFALDQRYDVAPLWQTLLWPPLTVALVVLGIRGSVGPKAINAGPAFFSSSPAVAQLTLNGAFTLREAAITQFARRVPVHELHRPLPTEQAAKITRRLLAHPDARFTGGPEAPMHRVVDTGRPRRSHNVVLIVLESMSWHYVGALGGDKRLTPNFDRLAEQGILMERCFAVGNRTTRGFVGLVAGLPDLFGESISTRDTSLGRVTTLASVLGRRGYETMFIYGGQPHYDHRRAFLGSNGFRRFVFEEHFASKTFRTHLGWCDEDLYRSADAVFQALAEDQPFFATLLTLSFHRDYDIPAGKIDPVDPDSPHADQLDAIRYADYALGRFIERAKQKDYFDNTIFVIAADHDGGFADTEPEPVNMRVPVLIYAPSIIGDEGRRVSTVCSQTDVPPTILALLGGAYEHGFFGSDILSRDPTEGRAVSHTYNNTLMVVDAAGMITLVPPRGAEPALLRFALPNRLTPIDELTGAQRDRRDRMARQGVAVVQTAERVYRSGGTLPPAATSQATAEKQMTDGATP